MTPPELIVVAPELVTYACPERSCLVRYRVSKGYFLAAREAIAQDGIPALPVVMCPSDSHPMFLCETQREHLSYRLWRCPKCGASRVGGDLPI